MLITTQRQDSFVSIAIIAVTRVHFVSNRMSYTLLRCCWCDMIILNAHAPTEDKRVDTIARHDHEVELYSTNSQSRSYHMKILLGDFNAKVARKHILCSNRLLETRFNMKLDMIIGLE